MNVIFFMRRLLLAMLLWILALPSQAVAGEEKPSTVGMILDVSGSMAGKRATAMKAAAKLFVATVPPNFELVIVDFNHSARSAQFKLRTPAEREAAMRHIDGLKIDGGTDYLSALRAAKLPPGAPALFLSDGENNDGPEPVLAFLKGFPPGPLFTIGIETPPAAGKLLSDMAVATRGSYIKADDSETMVKAFLGIAKQLGNYRTYLPKEEKVVCKNVVGRVVAFGFDAVPGLTGNPPLPKTIYQHRAGLPGEHVNLTAAELATPTAVTIAASQKRTPQGRLAAILRQDLLRAEMHLVAPDGRAAVGGELKASTKFFDSAGKLVDPRQRPDVSSVFELLDESGKVLAKVLAKPSQTEAALEATIPLPKKPGPITVKNTTVDGTQGPGFEAEQNRTIMLEKAATLEIQPEQIKLAGRGGRFETKLTVKVMYDRPITATFTAQVDGAVKGIRVLQAKTQGHTLELEFDASGAGVHRGFLLIQGAATVPIEPTRVPFEFTVKENALGLALPESRKLTFGPVLANSGSKQIAVLEFPGLDIDEVPYSVDVEDLSNGSTVIPFNADQAKVMPTKTKSARLALTAEVGNVPVGEYSATVIVRPAGSIAGKAWRTTVTLTVTEPLDVQPIDFGVIEVGKSAKNSLKFKNAGEAFPDIQVGKVTIDAKGGEIAATIPDKIAVGARQEKDIPVSLTVSPLVESRGLHKGSVVIRRSNKQEIVVPIQVTIVDVGMGPCGLLVAPGKIQIQAKPGEVAQFDLRTKFAAAAAIAEEELTAEAGIFKDKAGKIIDLEVAFKWQPATKLTKTTPVTVQGFLVAPDRRGTYTTTLTIRSKESGTVVVPLTLEVQ